MNCANLGLTVAVVFITTGGVGGQERTPKSAADTFRLAVETETAEAPVFRVDSNEAGEMVTAHDVQHGLDRFYAEDIVSAFFHEQPLTALIVVVTVSLGTAVFINNKQA